MGKNIIKNKISQNEAQPVLPISKGGTGATSPLAASDTLGFIPESKLNAANGVAGLDSQRYLFEDQIPDVVGKEGILINGPTSVNVNTSNTYQIVGYSRFNNYVVSSNVGTVNRTNGTISFTAPATPQTAVITVNGAEFNINIVPVSAYVNTPTVSSPTAGATNLGPNVTISASSFGVTGGSDTHEATDWQIATDIAFTNVIASSINDAINKTTWTANNLPANSNLYIRLRHKGVTLGYSNYSAIRSFTTKASYIPDTQQAILTASNKASEDKLGETIAIDGTGTRVTAGAPQAGRDGYGAGGRAYIFVRSGSTWTQEVVISKIDSEGLRFGDSVAITADGSRVAIGDPMAGPNNSGNSGKIYIYSRVGSAWSLEATLFAADRAAADFLGTAISMDETGTRLIAGAPGGDAGGNNSCGKIYCFVRSGTTWTQEAMVYPSGAVANFGLGTSCAVSKDGTRFVVGGRYDSYNNLTQGILYVYLRSGSTWSQEAIIAPADIAMNDYFGMFVDIDSSGTRIVASSYASNHGGLTASGKAYVYTRSGTSWTQEAVLLATGRAQYDYFGSDVSISADGQTIAIGAHGSGTIGKAYVFTRSGGSWTQSAALTTSSSTDKFGFAVAMSSDVSKLAISAMMADPAGVVDAGSLYIYS